MVAPFTEKMMMMIIIIIVIIIINYPNFKIGNHYLNQKVDNIIQ